jgi:hypothetical protein
VAKINPLFQDSTISSGTNIRTQFELKKVFVKESEKVFLVLVDQQEKKYIELKCLDSKTGTYSCSVWLKHKQEIRYQFLIKSENKVVSISDFKKGIAMYTVLETWAPSVDAEVLEEASQEIAESPKSSFVEEADGPNPTGEDFIENLIEKWGL